MSQTVRETGAKVELMKNTLFKNLKEFDEDLEAHLPKLLTERTKAAQTADTLRTLTEKWAKDLQQMKVETHASLNSELEAVERKSVEIKNLENELRQLEGYYAKLQSVNEKCDKKVSKYRQEIEQMRNTVRVYKACTRSNFVFQGENVAGYMYGVNQSKFEVFDLNPSDFPPEVIRESLWKLLEKLSHVDYLNTAEEQVNTNQ